MKDLSARIEELRKRYTGLRRANRDAINFNPLQTAARLTPEARRVLEEYGDGYSVCDYCKGDLHQIQNPPIQRFVQEDLGLFIDADHVRLTHGAREAKFMVMDAICSPGDTIVVDRNRHYSTILAAERAGLNIVEVENNGRPENQIDVEDFVPHIEQHHPKLLLLTYPDGNYGNLPDAGRLGQIAHQFRIPYVINAAYAIGRMPVSMHDLGADFIIGSGHKSMASAGPIGVLGISDDYIERTMHKSERYSKKEVGCLGCTVRGVPLLTLMASFPYVVERVAKWEEEVQKARWFSEQMEAMGFLQLGDKPHNHDLMMFETDAFYEISQTHPKKRAFLYEALKQDGITGVKHGLTKSMKVSTYGIPREDLEKVLCTFRDLLKEHG